jgi:hypothetical protein
MEKMLVIFRTCFNNIAKGKDGNTLTNGFLRDATNVGFQVRRPLATSCAGREAKTGGSRRGKVRSHASPVAGLKETLRATRVRRSAPTISIPMS